MPFFNEDGIVQKLKAQINDNIWLIFGDDDYLKEYYCNKLINACVDESLRFFNFHTFNDDEKTLDEIFTVAENLPVMCDKTCLLIRNYPFNQLKESDIDSFKKSLSEIPETTVMIFYYNTCELFSGQNLLPKWAGAVNEIARLGVAVNLSHRSGLKTAKMLVRKAADRNTSISEDDAQYLISIVGDDMQTIINEFDKVCSYANGKPVTKEIIDFTAVKCTEANVFDISTSLICGNTDNAYKITDELIKIKTPVYNIIGAMASTFVNIYRYKVARANGRGVNDFKDAFGYTSVYAITKLPSEVNSVPLSKIKEAVDTLMQYDARTKSASFEPEVLMSELTARLAGIFKRG